ncbi:MAG: hypothetical protein NTY36_08390 [Deltaproteobacteria bacterium]|nr:hypothetical protein [Deltaproteobacteria bacterium]
MKNIKRIACRPKIASGQLAEKRDHSARSIIDAVREFQRKCEVLNRQDHARELTGVKRVLGSDNLSGFSKIGRNSDAYSPKRKISKRNKKRLERRKETYISFPESIEHHTIIKMEPKAKFRVELKIREFRKAEPPGGVEPEVLIDV